MCNRFTRHWLLLSLLMMATSAAAQTAQPQNARDTFTLDTLELAPDASPLERELLRRMTPEQIGQYVNGASPEGIVLDNGKTLADFLDRKGVGGFEISWYSMDGICGMMSSGGSFVLSGTIGRSDAGRMAGGEFSLTSGCSLILAALSFFSDGFESGNTNNWIQTVP